MTASDLLTESALSRQIADCLKYCGYVQLPDGYNRLRPGDGVFWRNNSGASFIKGQRVRFGCIGTPDFIGFTPAGRFLCIEAKRPGQKLRKEQLQFLDHARYHGALVIVASCVEDVMRGLEEA